MDRPNTRGQKIDALAQKSTAFSGELGFWGARGLNSECCHKRDNGATTKIEVAGVARRSEIVESIA